MPNLSKQIESISLANMLRTAMSSDPTSLYIGHAGISVDSMQSIPSVTGVGQCGS